MNRVSASGHASWNPFLNALLIISGRTVGALIGLASTQERLLPLALIAGVGIAFRGVLFVHNSF